MQVISLVVGPISTNCYIVFCERTREAVVIDPGFDRFDEDIVLGKIRELGLSVKYIINTHGHIDHISGNAKLKRETGAKIAVHADDAEMLIDPSKNYFIGALFSTYGVSPPDILLKDGDEIRVGDIRIRVLHTPGHTPGSISLYIEEEGVVFTGDTLFAGSIGRTDLPGSSHEKIMRSIREKLLSLPDETRVYPGHGPETTIGIERRENVFLTDLL